jgi:hypothetical protein
MSHGRHNASSEVAHLVAEVRGLTPEEALELHGIEIYEDKTVYDTAYEETFKNLNTWASFVVAQEMTEDYDDEYETGKWGDDE